MKCKTCHYSDGDYLRGLCRRCHYYLACRGLLNDDDYPKLPRGVRGVSREHILEEYVHLRSFRVPVREIASRMGMKLDSFERAMRRAKYDGDPRAQDFTMRAA